jgi:hypothetical protein
MSQTEVTPDGLQPIPDYQAARSHIYPSLESLKWFIRQNRIELGQAGALSMPTGRLLIVPAAFDSAALQIGSRRARQG